MTGSAPLIKHLSISRGRWDEGLRLHVCRVHRFHHSLLSPCYAAWGAVV